MRYDVTRHEPRRMWRDPFDMGRVFERFFDNNWPLREWTEKTEWQPAVDVEETDDTIQVHADLPGVDPKHIDVSLEGDALTITARRDETQEQKEGKSHYRERFVGTFRRTIALPAGVDAEHIEADYKNGVLDVRCPIKEGAKPRAIEVRAK